MERRAHHHHAQQPAGTNAQQTESPEGSLWSAAQQLLQCTEGQMDHGQCAGGGAADPSEPFDVRHSGHVDPVEFDRWHRGRRPHNRCDERVADDAHVSRNSTLGRKVVFVFSHSVTDPARNPELLRGLRVCAPRTATGRADCERMYLFVFLWLTFRRPLQVNDAE